MRGKIFFITIILLSNLLFAQEKEEEKPVYGWIKEFVGNLNFTQNSFDNWTQGGEDSWAWQLDLLTKFDKNEEKYKWANSSKFSFGRTKVGDLSSRKAADEIKLESVLTYKVGVYVNPFIALSALTQFTEGFKYEGDQKIKISNILDPAYFTQSAGIGYEHNKVVKIRLGAALKETITDKYADIYANGEKTRVEFGMESVTDVNAKFSDNIIFTSKLELFSRLNRFDEVDVNWDNLFTAKVSKYINVSFNLKLFYDKDITTKRQLKQTLALGLSYNFL